MNIHGYYLQTTLLYMGYAIQIYAHLAITSEMVLEASNLNTLHSLDVE